jgi:hypothetical protein
MLRHAHFYMKGGKRTFAASANQMGNLKKADAQGYDPAFYDVHTRRTAATSQM